MTALRKINDVFMGIIKVVLIVFGTVMTFLVIMNVILRYVFNSGFGWSEEAARFLFIWVTFLGAILANDAVSYHGEHMRMDFIVEKFHGIPRKIIEEIAFIFILVLLISLFRGGLILVKSTWPFLTSALEIPKGLVYLCAPICFGYMIIQTLVRMIRVAIAKEDPTDEKVEETVKGLDEVLAQMDAEKEVK